MTPTTGTTQPSFMSTSAQTPTYATQADFIRAAIAATAEEGGGGPLSDRQFAMQVLGQDERTLRRYLARNPKLRRRVPGPVLALCARLIDPAHPPKPPADVVAPSEVAASLPPAVGPVYRALQRGLRDGWTVTALSTDLVLHPTVVRRHLRKLEALGLAERRGLHADPRQGGTWHLAGSNTGSSTGGTKKASGTGTTD
jgi:DNA-binding transcriptional ArsR family regulator